MGKSESKSKLARARGHEKPPSRRNMSKDEMAEKAMKAILQQRISGTNPLGGDAARGQGVAKALGAARTGSTKALVDGDAASAEGMLAFGDNHPQLRDDEHREAIRMWEELKKNELSAEETHVNMEVARGRLELEAKTMQAQLMLEAERNQIARAEVVVRALEVAAKAGVDGNRLLGMVQAFGGNLLSGPTEKGLDLGEAGEAVPLARQLEALELKAPEEEEE